MNKNILNAVIVGSLAMGLASCDENSWNDHYLNGFEGGVDYNNKETGSYTVSDADYAAIAKMLEGEAADDAEVEILDIDELKLGVVITQA